MYNYYLSQFNTNSGALLKSLKMILLMGRLTPLKICICIKKEITDDRPTVILKDSQTSQYGGL